MWMDVVLAIIMTSICNLMWLGTIWYARMHLIVRSIYALQEDVSSLQEAHKRISAKSSKASRAAEEALQRTDQDIYLEGLKLLKESKT